MATNSPTTNAIPRDGLVAEYLFDGDAADTSGQAHHGSVHGATPAADRFGRPAHACHFDGVDDYIEVAPPPTLERDALTVSCWVRFDERDMRGWTNCFVSQDNGNDEDQSRRVFQLSAFRGHIVWHRMIGARDPMDRRRVVPGVWRHVTGVHERGENRLYVDGELCDTVQHALWTHAEQPLHIGRKGSGESFFYFKGTIDDVRIYRRALQASEIAALRDEGGWVVPANPPAPTAAMVAGRWGGGGIVYLDLGVGANGKVTGRIMAGRPGNVAKVAHGTYDPASGALHLDGDAIDPREGNAVKWTIDGTVNRDDICVCARFNGFNDNFILTRRGAEWRWSRRSVRSHLAMMLARLAG